MAAAQGNATVLMDGIRYFTLTDVGARIWQLLEQPRSVREIVDIIGAEYDSPIETIERDTEQLLGELLRLRLITHRIA